MGRNLTSGKERWAWLIEAISPDRSLATLTLLGFCTLSAIATAMGFIDLRLSMSDADALAPLDLALSGLLTAFVVAAMVVALHNVVSAGRSVWMRILALVFYLMFTVWSVGFGFGFFWKEMAGREFTRAQFERMVEGLSASVGLADAALTSAERAISETASLSRERAELEEREGRTCANRPNSTPGDGPLTRSRFAFAERGDDAALNLRRDWLGPLEQPRRAVMLQLAALRGETPPTDLSVREREIFMRVAAAGDATLKERRQTYSEVFRGAEEFVAAANSARSLNAGPLAQRLGGMAQDVGPDPARPGSPDPARQDDPGYCWDVLLNEKLLAAQGQVRSVPQIDQPRFEFLEGPHATRAAFFSLLGWIGSLFGMSAAGGVAIPFGDKEFLALFASIAVDAGIFFLTLLRASDRPKAPPRLEMGDEPPKPPDLGWISDGA